MENVLNFFLVRQTRMADRIGKFIQAGIQERGNIPKLFDPMNYKLPLLEQGSLIRWMLEMISFFLLKPFYLIQELF